MSTTGGVSITFLGAAIKHLEKQYGKRMSGPEKPMNRFIAALAQAEEAFQELSRDSRMKGSA